MAASMRGGSVHRRRNRPEQDRILLAVISVANDDAPEQHRRPFAFPSGCERAAKAAADVVTLIATDDDAPEQHRRPFAFPSRREHASEAAVIAATAADNHAPKQNIVGALARCPDGERAPEPSVKIIATTITTERALIVALTHERRLCRPGRRDFVDDASKRGVARALRDERRRRRRELRLLILAAERGGEARNEAGRHLQPLAAPARGVEHPARRGYGRGRIKVRIGEALLRNERLPHRRGGGVRGLLREVLLLLLYPLLFGFGRRLCSGGRRRRSLALPPGILAVKLSELSRFGHVALEHRMRRRHLELRRTPLGRRAPPRREALLGREPVDGGSGR
mmetsp:Transcript_21332/g.69041  ORF Transcript_21332/g.69041 Transcript_21332/m.69041 type:complete len:339 (-) Transcript_21332:32-1048(-)